MDLSSSNTTAPHGNVGLLAMNYQEQNTNFGLPYSKTAYVKVNESVTLDELNLTTEKKVVQHQKEITSNGRVVKLSSEKERYICRIDDCQQSFANLSELQGHRSGQHLPIEYENECEICGKVFKSKHALKAHTQRHMDREYHCEECGKSFHEKHKLATHLRVHSGSKPHKCEYCEKAFSQSGNLMKHKRSVHNEEFLGGVRPHECPECLKSFKTQDMLRKHVVRHELKFTCTLCQEQFRIRKDFMSHMESVHNAAYMPAAEEKSLEVYNCPQCEKTFLTIKSLKFHQQTVHLKQKRYSCSFPGCTYQSFYKYTIDRHYQKHERKNDRMHCNNCLETFSTRKLLLDHLSDKVCMEDQISEDKKLYACVYCSSTFYSLSTLQKHHASGICQAQELDEKSTQENEDRTVNVAISEAYMKSPDHVSIKTEPAELDEKSTQETEDRTVNVAISEAYIKSPDYVSIKTEPAELDEKSTQETEDRTVNVAISEAYIKSPDYVSIKTEPAELDEKSTQETEDRTVNVAISEAYMKSPDHVSIKTEPADQESVFIEYVVDETKANVTTIEIVKQSE